jgi:CheY-like chemotaxis protein
MMVVDDDADHAASLTEILRLAGHDARPFLSGPDALAALARFTPDACLVDLWMSPMDGYTLAERLRARLGPGPVLMAVTGGGVAADDDRASVFDRVFTKPPNLSELLAALAVVRPGG